MPELTTKQIENVVDIVSNSEITYSHLPDDLIDHICCDVESEMSVGLSFNKALERVQCKFGDPGLQKIQEDTILLIDKKYRFMKTTMKIFGNVSLALIGIATIFKIFHWPGAGILLTLGFVSLGLIFYPATIMANFRKNGRKKPVLHILSAIGGIALMLGILFKIQHWPSASILLGTGWITLLVIFLPTWLIVYTKENKSKKGVWIYVIGVIGVILFELSTLFKIQHWPGAGVMMMTGAVLVVSIFLPFYTYKLYKKSDFTSGRFIYLIILVSFFLIFGFLINLNLARRVYKGLSFTDLYAQTEKNYFVNSNSIILKSIQLTNNMNEAVALVKHKADSLSSSISEMKRNLIIKTEQINQKEVEKYLNNIELISDKSQNRIVNQLLFGDDNNAYAKELKQGLEAYKQILVNSIGQNYDIEQEIDILFNLNDIYENGYYKSWEFSKFKHNSLFTTLIQLTDIERNIRIAENLVLNYYANNQGSVKKKIVSNE